MSNPFDTQKIRVDLMTDLRKAKQAYRRNPNLDDLALIQWIKNRLSFLGSPAYQERKKRNEQL